MRMESGIPGLDSLIGGGFLQNSVNLITGETGTGKTIFCCQFLWHGLQKGDTCLYLSLEEDPKDILEDAMQFGFGFEKYEKRGLFKIIYHDPAQINNLGSIIIDEIKRIDAKRLVIDSTSIIGLAVENPSQIRKMLYNIMGTIKKAGCTALITSEITEGSKKLSRFGVEEFVVDGVVVLRLTELGGQEENHIQVRKMRRTNHARGYFPFSFTPKGIVLKREKMA